MENNSHINIIGEESNTLVATNDINIIGEESNTLVATNDLVNNASSFSSNVCTSHTNKITVEDLKCGICRNILHKPVTLFCQHNFCLGCLRRLENKVCPLCNKTFLPIVCYNILLDDICKKMFPDEHNLAEDEHNHIEQEFELRNRITSEIYDRIGHANLQHALANNLSMPMSVISIQDGVLIKISNFEFKLNRYVMKNMLLVSFLFIIGNLLLMTLIPPAESFMGKFAINGWTLLNMLIAGLITRAYINVT